MTEQAHTPRPEDQGFTPIDLDQTPEAIAPPEDQAELLAKSGIIAVAESYAFAQVEIEDKILPTSSPEEWENVAYEVAARYPALKPYEYALAAGAGEMQTGYDAINYSWRMARAMADYEPTKVDKDDPRVEIAGPNTSRKLLGQLLARRGVDINEVKGPITAEKGMFSLAFKLDREDLVKIYHLLGNKEDGEAGEGLGAFYIWFPHRNHTRLPAFFIPTPQSESDEDTQITTALILHEVQHLKADQFETGQLRHIEAVASWQKRPGTELLKHAVENLTADTRAERTLKDELEAEFALIISHDWVASLKPEQATTLSAEQMRDYLANYTEEFFGKDYIEPGELTPELKRNAQKAIDALVTIRTYYINNQGLEPVLADKISSKMLRILPLKSWPAAAKLILNGRSRAADLRSHFDHNYQQAPQSYKR